MTISISKVLVQNARLEIFSCKQTTAIDIKGWIANQNYSVDQYFNNYLILNAANEKILMTALANDCNRMAIAAIESIAGLQCDKKFKQSGAWGIIRAYYSSFFAAHSIMRMFGISCTQLDKTHAIKIHEMADIYGKTNTLEKIEKGFYSININSDFKSLSFSKLKDSHSDTWATFLKLIEDLIKTSQNATALSQHKIDTFDILTSIKNGLCYNRCKDKGNWLSVFRNSVNYQHTHGVWYPYEQKTSSPTFIEKMSEDWLHPPFIESPSIKNGDIEEFFKTASNIVSIFRELLVACFEKSDNNKSIFACGSIKQLNLLKAA